MAVLSDADAEPPRQANDGSALRVDHGVELVVDLEEARHFPRRQHLSEARDELALDAVLRLLDAEVLVHDLEGVGARWWCRPRAPARCGGGERGARGRPLPWAPVPSPPSRALDGEAESTLAS